MPEWPEVTLTTRALEKICAGKVLEKVKVVHVLKHNVAPLPNITQILPCSITRVWNKGKNIVFALEKDEEEYTLLSHMMLTGSWSTEKNEHTCLVLTLKNKEGTEEKLYYRDTRRFGRLDFGSRKVMGTYLEKIKPDMFQLTSANFKKEMRKKNRTGIYSCIMDQKAVLSGVGNYVAAESLYRVKINPKCRIAKLSDKHLENLYHAIRAVCEESLLCQGMSISDYVGIDDKPGTFQDFLQVYKKSPHKVKIVGRNCYWDPQVQTIV